MWYKSRKLPVWKATTARALRIDSCLLIASHAPGATGKDQRKRPNLSMSPVSSSVSQTLATCSGVKLMVGSWNIDNSSWGWELARKRNALSVEFGRRGRALYSSSCDLNTMDWPDDLKKHKNVSDATKSTNVTLPHIISPKYCVERRCFFFAFSIGSCSVVVPSPWRRCLSLSNVPIKQRNVEASTTSGLCRGYLKYISTSPTYLSKSSHVKASPRTYC